MIIETKVIKQGNSNVIVLPKETKLKPKDKIRVLIIPNRTNKVGDILGVYKNELKNIDTDKTLKEVKKELWGE